MCYVNKDDLKNVIKGAKDIAKFSNILYWYTQANYNAPLSHPLNQMLNDRVERDMKIIEEFRALKDAYKAIGLEIA